VLPGRRRHPGDQRYSLGVAAGLALRQQVRQDGDLAALALIAGMSPAAWQHINLFGSFEFGPQGSSIDIDVLAAYYADPAYWTRIVQARSQPGEP
jgi:hypothetical protein